MAGLSRQARVLLVEDDPDHLETIVESLGNDVMVTTAQTVGEAKDRLRDAASRGPVGWLDLVLLDVRLGDDANGGYEVLSFIRQDPELKRIPVVVLTTSGQHGDIQAMYEAGANSFIEKHISLSEFSRRITVLKDYWFTVARLPEPPA
jgi:CheY-like chemotaxis protein